MHQMAEHGAAHLNGHKAEAHKDDTGRCEMRHLTIFDLRNNTSPGNAEIKQRRCQAVSIALSPSSPHAPGSCPEKQVHQEGSPGLPAKPGANLNSALPCVLVSSLPVIRSCCFQVQVLSATVGLRATSWSMLTLDRLLS